MVKWLQKVSNLLQRILFDRKYPEQIKAFPSVFYRGIANETDIADNVYLKSSAFQFGSVTPLDRNDGYRELSIVWNDCDEALSKLLSQRKKKGSGPQFSCGYATIKLSKFESTLVNYITGNLVDYERKPIEEDKENDVDSNPYHGNILLHESASEQLKKNIQHSLATIATFTRRPQ